MFLFTLVFDMYLVPCHIEASLWLQLYQWCIYFDLARICNVIVI